MRTQHQHESHAAPSRGSTVSTLQNPNRPEIPKSHGTMRNPNYTIRDCTKRETKHVVPRSPKKEATEDGSCSLRLKERPVKKKKKKNRYTKKWKNQPRISETRALMIRRQRRWRDRG
ncbi:unnamed protein product [Sphenostylis stenocarpa]|uniref:Uncharacterized protein n=1 Tax=Sphenostylis stenocarpa TaxID=92480 RepID=A0AA86S0R5_9FABA|nr:unnamed protein product [Sphenostylis stenocarpa]